MIHKVQFWFAFLFSIVLACPSPAQEIELFGIYEAVFQDAGDYANPYTELEATATVRLPNGTEWKSPLFWDGGDTWKLRIRPNIEGQWSFRVSSRDPGVHGQGGTFRCVASQQRGSIQAARETPWHFEYENGDPMWFLGDTAWALFTDHREELHDRDTAQKYLRDRSAQGFNVVHSMLLSEAGWGNSGGLPFVDIDQQLLNPGYWREVDQRLAYANDLGIVVGLAIAWGDKRKEEPFAWRRFPNLEARKRYARYVAARFSAFNVYFLVSGEWHGEIRTRPSTEAEVRSEFIEIGDTLHAADPYGRMIGIHPMTSGGSVREFNVAQWMTFGDYQQNYQDLHARILESRRFHKPVVNSEYGYHLRDRDGDGIADKDNSTSLDSIRHASWDIVMAGGYLVTGFGTTYFGGNRDPGPFDLEAEKNDAWEEQIGFIKSFFSKLAWWTLEPHDDGISSSTARGKDGKEIGRIKPPHTTYWMLTAPGKDYVGYVRGVQSEVTLHLGLNSSGNYRVSRFNPRTGEISVLHEQRDIDSQFTWTPPDSDDWVLHLHSIAR